MLKVSIPNLAAWSERSAGFLFRSPSFRIQELFCSVFRTTPVACSVADLFRVQEPLCSLFRATPVSCSGALRFNVQEPYFYMFRAIPVSCSGALSFMFRRPIVSCLEALLFLVYFPHTQSRPGDRFFVPFFARRKLVQLLCLNTDQYRYLSLCSQFITHNRPVIRRCVMHEAENASTKLSRMHVSIMR